MKIRTSVTNNDTEFTLTITPAGVDTPKFGVLFMRDIHSENWCEMKLSASELDIIYLSIQECQSNVINDLAEKTLAEKIPLIKNSLGSVTEKLSYNELLTGAKSLLDQTVIVPSATSQYGSSADGCSICVQPTKISNLLEGTYFILDANKPKGYSSVVFTKEKWAHETPVANGMVFGKEISAQNMVAKIKILGEA
jgi:hypothetical protein